MMVAAGLEPLEQYPGAGRGWRCRCLGCLREVTPRYASVQRGRGGCLWCAGRRLDPAQAEGLMVDAGLQPLEPYPGATKPWRCRCVRCGAIVRPLYNNIQQGFGGCRACGTARAASRLRGSEAEAVEVMRAAGLEPLEPYVSNVRRWRCRCLTCQREVTPTFATVQQGGGCKYCGRRAVDPDDAHRTMVDAGLAPLERYPGATKPWRCTCATCGREVLPSYTSIQSGRGGCGFCAGIRVDPDEARLVMVDAGLEPLEPYPGAHTGWRCRCVACDREVSPSYRSVQSGGGCRFCSAHGFDYAAPGVVYLLTHGQLFAVKVGVTTKAARNDRIAEHTKHGWVLVASWDVSTGDIAYDVEQQVLGWWRGELGAPAAVPKEAMTQGGWSETASLLWVDVAATQARIESLILDAATVREFVIDTSCAIVLMDGQSSHKPAELGALRDLYAMAERGEVTLRAAAALRRDWERITDASLRERRLAWLDSSVLAGPPVAGLFRLGVSQLDGPDVLASDAEAELDEKLTAVLPAGSPNAPIAKRTSDRDHLLASHRSTALGWVTLDHKTVLKKQADLAALGVIALWPSEALALAAR